MSPASGASTITDDAAARPFLKWAGGKRQLLPEIRRFYPDTFDSYIEPFLGSGAVFFDLAGSGRLAGKRVLLMDRNPDLVSCYVAVRDRVDAVVGALRELEAEHRADARACYYAVRDERFNPERRRLEAGRHPVDGHAGARLAAMLIYLNRTCYNGLFRLNARGDFNTPMGRYAKPAICDAGNLRRVSRLLRSRMVRIRVGDFADVVPDAGPGAFVYFDPPYAPVSRTANFRSYTSSGFSDVQQRALQEVVVTLARRGAHVLLSNSVAPLTRELYETSRSAGQAGLAAHRVPARRAINSNASSRGVVSEYLVSNLAPASGSDF